MKGKRARVIYGCVRCGHIRQKCAMSAAVIMDMSSCVIEAMMAMDAGIIGRINEHTALPDQKFRRVNACSYYSTDGGAEQPPPRSIWGICRKSSVHRGHRPVAGRQKEDAKRILSTRFASLFISTAGRAAPERHHCRYCWEPAIWRSACSMRRLTI